MVLILIGNWLGKTTVDCQVPERTAYPQGGGLGVYAHSAAADLTCVATSHASDYLPCLQGEGPGIRYSPGLPLALVLYTWIQSFQQAPHWGPFRAQVQPAGSWMLLWEIAWGHLLQWSVECDPLMSGSHGPQTPSHICLCG